MASSSSSTSTRPQVQPQTLHIQAQDSSFTNTTTVTGQAVKWIFQILFYLQLFLISALVIFITRYYRTSDSSTTHHFHPHKWYPPLLASTLCAGILGFTWHCIIACYPKRAFIAAFWLSPLLTLAMGILFMLIQSAWSWIPGLFSLLSAAIQSLYGLWVNNNNRFKYATEMFQDAIYFPLPKAKCLTFLSIIVATLYCCFLVYGIGGARAMENKTKLTDICIIVIIVSLVWTMQVMKNAMQVTISRVKYIFFTNNREMKIGNAFCDTIKHLIGSVSLGSILVPFIVLFRGFARSQHLLGGKNGECMFSCDPCAMGLAALLVSYGNRWGFVHVGVYNKGFVQASCDTWEMFMSRVGLQELIDLDLTGAFCFLSGVAVGAICCLVSGIWSLIVYKDYAMELSIYAFIIGYFICRLAIAWPQASVLAYYVAYAHNPEDMQFEETIKARLEQLRVSHLQRQNTADTEEIRRAYLQSP
ncbi:unnamed protein product [Lathyrus sativus]|nr:unnamed protein product [Lathyrus sativus]CAK8068042.1 unnamed protein product [Lathyrus sativus]